MVTKSMAQITVSIVTYNNAAIIADTLHSVFAHIPTDGSVEILVIDNRSTDGTWEVLNRLGRLYPNLKLVLNSTNAGYGRGHNLAIRNVTSRYHLILNPDVLFTSDILSELAKFMNENPEIGMVVPKVLNPDGSLQALNKQSPTIYDLFLRRCLPSRFRPFFQKRLNWYEMLDVGYDSIRDVPFIPGCFMFCRSDVLKKMGGFDERYFLYFEDADLTAEVRKAGYRTVYRPNDSVVHLWSRAYYKNYRMAIILLRNGIRFFNKWGWKFY